MKGCLSIIIKTIIGVLVYFGLMHIGVIDFIKEKIQERQNVSQEEILEEAKDVVDLSEIDDEYSVEKNLKILKNRMIIAEHNASGQKMIIIEAKNDDILTQSDIKEDNLQEKIDKLAKKYKYKLVKFDKLKVTKKGEFKGINQVIPYVKVNIEVSNLPIKEIEGILGVAKNRDGNNIIVISVNQEGKYSQIITEGFYKKVR